MPGSQTTSQTAADFVARAIGPERLVTAWKETANGTLRADCPFNEEKPGNLFIYPGNPSIFTCFGCGSRGTAVKVKEGYRLRAGA